MFHVDYFLIVQVIEVIIPPVDVRNYVCKECEVNFNNPDATPNQDKFLVCMSQLDF